MRYLRSLFYRFLDRYQNKSWMDNGFRILRPRTWQGIKVFYDRNEYQGDIRHSIVIHLFVFTCEVTKWVYN